jgi:hypothetical protein
MPSLPTASDAVGTGAAAGRDQDGEEVAQPAARSRSRGVSWATGDTEHEGAGSKGSRGRGQQGADEQELEDGYGGLAHGAGAW